MEYFFGFRISSAFARIASSVIGICFESGLSVGTADISINTLPFQVEANSGSSFMVVLYEELL